MSHFAEIDTNGIVLRVVVVNNSDILDAEGVEREELGIALCKRVHGEDTNWVQTSYNATFRKNYAVIGGKYDPVRDAFIPPRPHPSWLLEEEFLVWEPPIPVPSADGTPYFWDEANQRWGTITP